MTGNAVQIEVHGRVQGVGFRAWAGQIAGMFGLTGWARNRHDGWVEIVLDGSQNGVGAAIVMIERGPPGARVENIAVRPAEAEELSLTPASGFSVLPDL